MINTPPEITHAQIKTGSEKASPAPRSTMLLSFLSGIFLSIGGAAYLIIAASTADPGLGKFLGAAIFPVGLIMIILGGGYLFTGNNLMLMGLLDKRYSFYALIKNWTMVWLGNLAGSIFVAALIYGGALFVDSHAASGLSPAGDLVVKLAYKKVELDFMSLLARGILCNIAVAAAVLISGAARDVAGKVLLMWFPVAAFVMAGYEHCVANMFYLPLGIFLGADITWSQMFAVNLLPVTLGNVIGGGILSLIYWYIHVELDRKPSFDSQKDKDEEFVFFSTNHLR